MVVDLDLEAERARHRETREHRDRALRAASDYQQQARHWKDMASRLQIQLDDLEPSDTKTQPAPEPRPNPKSDPEVLMVGGGTGGGTGGGGGEGVVLTLKALAALGELAITLYRADHSGTHPWARALIGLGRGLLDHLEGVLVPLPQQGGGGTTTTPQPQGGHPTP